MEDPFFSIVIANHKADRDLGANSHANWRTVYRKRKADKNLTTILMANQLNRMGLTGQQFLTNLGQYTLDECLPIHITFKRFYAGKAQKWDEDNLYSAYKAVQDGIKHVLGVDDSHFKPAVEQIRDEFTELEIVIEPAWAVKK